MRRLDGRDRRCLAVRTLGLFLAVREFSCWAVQPDREALCKQAKARAERPLGTCPFRLAAAIQLRDTIDGAAPRGGPLNNGDGRAARLTVLRRRTESAGLTPEEYSAHSLRAGFVTQAIRVRGPSGT